MRIISILAGSLVIWALAAGPLPAADDRGGMCDGQAGLNDREVRDALAAMADIAELGDKLKPENEETIIRGRGLTAARLNCILGKVMAGNDIFNWGQAAAYGVSLTGEEEAIVRQYAGESQRLKRYLEEVLNIKVDNE
ncbi:MAG: hypothetical protein LBP55_07825 [Candidatus Adiutrix sp.]|jgi:hypothetical protein|nr:hypothetical protein [Candidatus Adiutrix sp.]